MTRPQQPARPDGPLRVLVVDDEADLATMCRMILEAAGHEVSTARDGETAMRQLGLHQFDLVLLDLTLPGMSGWDVLAAVRTDPATVDLPVVIATARTDVEDQRRSWRAGANAFLAKPFDDVRLLDAVRQAAERAAPSARSEYARTALDRIGPPSRALDPRPEDLAEAVSDIVIGFAMGGAIRSWNAAAEAALGHTAEEALGKTFHLLLDPAHVPSAEEAMQRVAKGTMPGPVEALWVRKDGSPVLVRRVIVPIHDASGAMTGWWVVASPPRDAGGTLYRDLLEAAPDAVIVTDDEGRIVLVNLQAERLYGYRREDLVGVAADILVPAAYREGNEARRTAFYRAPRTVGAGIDMQLFGQHRDGHEFPIEVNVSPIRTEQGTFVCIAVRDITERHRDEALFRELLEAAPDAMVITDEQGRVSLVNARTEQLFGYERAEITGQPAHLLVSLPGDEEPAWRPPPADGTVHERSLLGRRRDGSEFPVDVSFSPISFHGGTLVSASVRDATQRTRERDILAEAFAREQEALERLRDLDRQRSDFISTVSHELRTPLTVVMGFAKMLVGRWDAIDDATRRHLLGRIAASGQKLEQLIADMLDIARLERGHLDVVLERRSLRALVDEAVGKIQILVDDHVVVIEVDDDLSVVADEFAFTRVLENLLTNAAKFSEPGTTIHVMARPDGDEVTVSVSDEGPGIPEADRPRVFERYFRASGPSAVVPGTGIGLAIAHEYVQAQSGRIWVAEAESGGCVFCFTLPGN